MRGATYREIGVPTNGLPFPIANVCRGFPQDSQGAFRVIAERGVPRMREFRRDQLTRIEECVRLLPPKLSAVRHKMSADCFATRSRLRLTLSEEPLQGHDMGGRAGCCGLTFLLKGS